MSIPKLGKLEEIKNLREVWTHEAREFTTWLAQEENMALLGEALDIDIAVEEQEASVGDFRADIVATEARSGRRIVIENQLEDTNHDHLGKIITYASGRDAEIIVWVVRRAREEQTPPLLRSLRLSKSRMVGSKSSDGLKQQVSPVNSTSISGLRLRRQLKKMSNLASFFVCKNRCPVPITACPAGSAQAVLFGELVHRKSLSALRCMWTTTENCTSN